MKDMIRFAGWAAFWGDTSRVAGHPTDMFTQEPIPDGVSSMNAYLGARAIAQALDAGAGAGADVVVTGRCVDAAVVLGPLLNEFGWSDDDYDLLAAESLVGHIIECGPQCTGGIHTDWASVPGSDDIGYPIAEVRLEQLGPDRVQVSGARGSAPTTSYLLTLPVTVPNEWDHNGLMAVKETVG